MRDPSFPRFGLAVESNGGSLLKTHKTMNETARAEISQSPITRELAHVYCPGGKKDRWLRRVPCNDQTRRTDARVREGMEEGWKNIFGFVDNEGFDLFVGPVFRPFRD